MRVINLTGSGKRDNFVLTMIFQYRHCGSKTPNIFSFIILFCFWLSSIYNSLATLTPNLRNGTPSNWSSEPLKDCYYLYLLFHPNNVVKRGWA